MDQLIRTNAFEGEGVDRWMMPAQHFSGDVLAASHAPSGALHAILADGTGHGLSAALSVIPVTEVFYEMTERGFPIASIARELNRKIKKLMPTGRFVAATLVAVRREERTIEVWNGGNPEALLIGGAGRLLRSWPSAHPALGILNCQEFDDRTERYRWSEAGQLYMCSDGLLEAENAEGQAFEADRMQRILAESAPERRLRWLRAALTAHLGGRPAHDDVSVLVIDCFQKSQGKTPASEYPVKPESGGARPSAKWRLGLRLSASELKTIDILPFLMEWVDQVTIEEHHRGRIFLMLAELLNNAVDHGLLKLDSALKASPDDGFERYMTERMTRLEALEAGFVEIELKPVGRPEGEFLQLHVKDSGDGFDYDALLQADIAHTTERFGRGVALIRDLCANVFYLGNGNEVVALYRLS